MRYFKIVLACFGFIFAVVGITAGVLFLTGKFDKEVIQPEDIAFEITEKLTEDDFEVVVNTTTENVTEKDVTLSLTNQTETDGMISDGVITVPKVVKLGKPFTVKVNKTHYAGMTEEWNVGGTSIIRAKSTNPLIQEATPLTVEVDVPVYSLGVDLVTTTGTKIGTVSARDLKNYMRTLAEGEKDKKVVELAVGSVVRLQPVFTPAKSAKTTKGEQRKVLFEIPTAWKGIHIDFVDGENDLVEVLRQTTIEDIKINAYCFRTSADEYEAQSQGYSDEELITIMNSNGISGESAQIFGTNQKITSFTSSTNNEYMTLAINSPLTLIANGTGENAFNLGLGLASDAGIAKLEDKIAVIKLFAYWQNDLGEWEDAGDKLMIVGQTSSNKVNGVKAKINKNDANLSSWRVIASETGKFKIVANLSYEYYSSSSSVPTVINFDIDFANILVSDPISSDVAWKNTLPAIKTLVVLDGETAAEKYYPTINLADYVDIKNPNATYKVVRFFAYSTEGLNLSNIINCSLYSGSFAVPDSSYQYEVFEIPNGILTAKDVGSFRIFFATVVSDYMGNPKIQFGEYLFESFSNTNTINVVKSLKQLDASMAVNEQEDGKDYNKNTDENTRDYIFHVRQQDEKVFTLSLFVSDVEIFERDYADGKISIDFLLGGQKSNILSLTGDYTIDVAEKRIDFQVSVNSLPNNDQPTLECKITYDLDHRLDKFVSNNGNKVQIKVLNGFAQEIVFDAVKDAYPRNSAENPIQVEIKFNAGSDNVATNIEYGITLNGQNLILEDLSKVTINDEALNRNYTLSSSKPAVIAIEDSLEGAKLSILGSTEDEDVVITATAADGSGLSTSIYFRVLASLQITLTPDDTEITIDGYQGNQINFRSYFDAKAGEIDLNNLLEYNVPIENANKFAFADDTLRIVSTLGRDASLQLYITSDFGFTKIIPIRIVSNITASSTYAFNDQGLDDADFVARGETPPTERGTRVYAENSREISFVLTQEQPTLTNISVSVDDFELPKNGGVQNISYNNGILTVCFDAVSQMTEKTIVFKKNFSENDEYAFVYTMKFLVFPNIKASLVSNVGTEENPASYISGETVIYDTKDNSNGLIKLERILGSNIISEHAALEAKINGEWVALSSNSGVFTLLASFRAVEGGYVEIRITYDGYVLAPISLFFKPFFDESVLLDAKVLYGGKLYVPFIASGDNSIALTQAEGVVYTIINATSEQYLRIRGNQIEKLDRLYTKIISTEKLRIENNNGVTELPILILPIKYPFVAYASIENAESEETYRNVDLKQVIESDSFYDTLEAGSEEVIDLKSKILVDGLEERGALVSVVNADGSTNNYVNYDDQNLTITANSVGKDQMVYVKVKCGAEFEESFEFVYRIKITANQQIKVFYPYVEYNEEYNVENAYEYLYFGSKNQISLDLLEEFDANLTPNKNLLEKLFETTNGKTYARRFVVVREKDGVLIPLEYKDLHFEIASVGIGKTVIPTEQVSNYAVINEKSTTDGVLQNVNLLINRGQATETIYVTVRAFTTSGAEAFYRLRVGDKPVSYKTYYKNQRITSDDFSVASNGQSEINLNESVLVKIDENPEQVVSPNAYKFYLIIHEKLGTDYSQFIELNNGFIRISTLVNDVETTVVIYNAAGEISRFNLILKCTIDHEVKSTTMGSNGVYDIGKNIDFFNTAQSTNNYSMKEISTRLYVKNYLNGVTIGETNPNNLFINVGGYSIKDISKQYKQYVMLDNIKVYAENLFDTWGGKFYLGEAAKYDVLTDYKGKYIRFNGSVIRVREDKDGVEYFDIPLQSTTDKQTVAYQISYDEKTNEYFVIIPHLKFSSGNDTRDYVLFNSVVDESDLSTTKIEPYGTTLENVASCTTYVYAYVNGYVRYKVDEVEVEENGTKSTNLKVSILRVSHNNVQYTALVDENHNDDEYILVDAEKHYFTRFYTINYDGIAANKDGVANVPKIRYMLARNEDSIDLSKVIFYTQEGKSENVLKLDDASYVDGLFTFFVDNGGEELEPVNFVQESDAEGNQKATWKIKIDKGIFTPITIVIKDTTAKYVVGRLTIIPTVETKTSESDNNIAIHISAGSDDINYQIESPDIEGKKYFDAMGKDGDIAFDPDIKKVHDGWTEYVYVLGESDYENISINEGTGLISKPVGSPWGKITVGAKLRYQNVNKANLTTTIKYSDWKNAFFGENAFNDYNDLKNALGAQRASIDLSENINDGNAVELDENGNITNVAFGSTVTLAFKQECEKCKDKIALGETHDCWFALGTEEITDISGFTEEQIKLLASSDGSFEEIDGSDEGKKYVYTLQGELQKSEGGVWTLVGKVIKTTQQKHSFTAKFVYEEQANRDLSVELLEEAKDPDAGEEQPTTYGKTIADSDLQSVYENLGFASFEEFKNAIISLSTTSGTVAFVENGIAIAGATEQTVTLSYTLNLPRALGTQTGEFEVKPLEINDKGYLALAKALFGEQAKTILGYANWDALLADCDVEFAGSGLSSVGQEDGSLKYYFGGQKTINLTLTTQQAKHTATFYIVNEENDKTIIHGVGNLKKIDVTLNDYKATKDISSVVYVGNSIWALPMSTSKYLKDGLENANIAQILQGVIGDYKDNLVNNNFMVLCKNDAEENMALIDQENYTFGALSELKTATELVKDGKDPFNTITLYHNKYAILNIHIYLEDYDGDASGINLKIYETKPQTQNYKIENKDENENVVSSISFNVSEGQLTTILTKVVNQKEVTYITQNAKMTGNKYLFENGLLVEADGTDIVLKMINKKDINDKEKIRFSFDGIEFVVDYETSRDVYTTPAGENVVIKYFEGLKDLVLQPENSDIEEGEKTYKAEKTGDNEDDSDVVYKDKIEGNDFNFENWDYNTSYENENGQTMEATGKTITIVNLGDNKKIKITINGIRDAEGNLIEGGYTFVVDLNEQSAVNIIGGHEGATSPSDPIDGGTIASGQEKTIKMGNGEDVFNVEKTQAELQTEYVGDKAKDESVDDQELVDALYKLKALSYLKGVLTFNDQSVVSSNVFRFKKDGEITTVSLIVTDSTNDVSYEYVISQNEDKSYSLIASDNSLEELDKFELVINKNLYDVVGTVEEYTEETKQDPTQEGEQTGEETGEGSGEGETGEENPSVITKKRLNITVTPVFTYSYKIESNGSAIEIVSSDKDAGEFEKTGKLLVKGKHTSVESIVKIRFAVLRGRVTGEKGATTPKEVAFAYYSLSVKPSVDAKITYPTISTSTKDEKGNFIQDKQTTEFFYAGAGVFDINAKSNISMGNEAARMVVTKYAYGTFQGAPATAEIKPKEILLINGKQYTAESSNNISTIRDEKGKTIGEFYIPNLDISYTASSSQNIIKGKDENKNDILTNNWEDGNGKFNFDMTGVTVSEAEVVISVQAEVDGYKYTFGQYILTVCKNPVISTRVEIDPTHLDKDGAEILPIDGTNTSIKPFDTTTQDSYGYVGGVPRLQFVYNNLILNSDYNKYFRIKDTESADITINGYAIYQTEEKSGVVKFKFDGQDVSGNYKYKTVWDYDMNPDLDSHTIEGNEDPAHPGELLNYYYLNAGKTYNIVETFGITKRFKGKFGNIHSAEFFDVNDENEINKYKNVEFTSDKQSINILGAPEGGMSFRIKFKPYKNADEIIIGITILPSIEIKVNYQVETRYEDDPDSYAYGLISSGTTEYELVKNKRGCDFSIERNGVLADVTKNDYTIEIVASQTDASLGVSVEQNNESAKLFIKNPPQLNAKRVVLKISDNYGYTQYLRYVVAATTQVVISSSDIVFETGGEIEWDKNNQFPISFKKENEETIQLASFYEATITGAKETETKDGEDTIISSNISDNYGDASSLRATSGNDGKLYGVQLDSVITYTYKDSDGKDAKKLYIPFAGEPISYDVYKLAEQDGTVLKSFDKYKKQIVKYDGENKTWDSTNPNGVAVIGDAGVFNPQVNKATAEYYLDYVIELYRENNSSTPAATIVFTILQVSASKNLYYASRQNPADCYTFEYDISIDGTKLIVDGDKIINIGNAQYGSATSINTTLKIGVTNSRKNIIAVDYEVNKFKINNNEYVISSYETKVDTITDGETTTNVTDNKFKIDKTEYTIKYNTVLDKIIQGNTEIEIADNKFNIGETEYLISYDKENIEIKYNSTKTVSITNNTFTIEDKLYTISFKTFAKSMIDGENNIVDIKNNQFEIEGKKYTLNCKTIINQILKGKDIVEIQNNQIEIETEAYKLILNNGENNIKNPIIQLEHTSASAKIDTISVGILLRFGIYPQVKQQVSGLTSYDYVGIGDNLNTIVAEKEINLIAKEGAISTSKTYYTILGNTTSKLETNKTADVMQSGKFDKEYEYDSSTRVLSLKATLDNENKAVINNIQYTYDGTNKTLTIGYRNVTLTDNKFDDEVTGISYQVKENTLYVSKKVDNAGKVTINNIQYTVASNETVSYETLYESIFVVWVYESKTYWAQWNYKVVDKFNQVTTGDPLEAQDGNIKVKLDWVSGDYRFNANTLELWKKGDKAALGTAKWISNADGNRYDIVIGGTTYKIVVENGNMKFKNGESYYQVDSTDLALTEETTQNSSWADKIKLTGLDGGKTSLNAATDIIVKVGGGELTKADGKYTIKYTIDGKEQNLVGESLNLQIFYKSKIKEEGLTLTDDDYYEKLLKFNGNEIKVTFEHFTVPTNA